MNFDVANFAVSLICALVVVGGVWVAVKEDIAELKQRLANVEASAERNTDVNEKLTGVLSDLRVAIAELSVEMKHVKEQR